MKGGVALRQHGREPARRGFGGLGDVAAGKHAQVVRLAGLDVEHRQVGVGAVDPQAGIEDGIEKRLDGSGTAASALSTCARRHAASLPAGAAGLVE